MNYKKPETLEELEANRDSHPNRGKIKGKSVVRSGSVELRGTIPKPLYEQMLCVTSAFSIGKAEAAQFGAWEAISQITNHERAQDFIKLSTVKYDGSYTLFRGYVPAGLYESLTAILCEKGYYPEDTATIVISCFVSKSERAYRKRLEQLKAEFNVEESIIVEAFKGESKKVAIDKKINKLKSGEELTELDKIKII
ncbi:hypothetical protein NIES2101_26850 [Calothrix sp. HK-06]|nr:hypothetical protein NIES2101_26850 [Calothrix sp. HK-06]